MITLKNTWLHFKKICTHKYWVAYYCFKAGIPIRGLLHDMSKFSPTEFWESVAYYQGTSSPIDACKKANGWSKAWMHHKGRNAHHYEYWFDNFDKGGEALVMPYEYAVEMICDYLGAGRAYYGKEFTYQKEYSWWLNKRQHTSMHMDMIKFVDKVFSCIVNKELGINEMINSHTLRTFYDESISNTN